MTDSMLSKTHPLILFWIGVLTGAVIVALVFMYRQSEQLQNSVINSQNIQQLQKMGQIGPTEPVPQMQMQSNGIAAPVPQPYAPVPQPYRNSRSR